MESIDLDLVVIGSGPGGQKAAIQAAKLGKRVAVVEKDIVVGGACLNSGTIPSKTMRAAILDMTNFYERSFYGKDFNKHSISINDLYYRLLKVVYAEEKLIANQFKKNAVRFINGAARFRESGVIDVIDASGNIFLTINYCYALIATGSLPRNPLEIPFNDTTILDSTRLLAIDRLPKTLIVLGGGIIGSEYASFFAALGTKVLVLDKKDRMLPLLDKEVGMHLQNALEDIGLTFVPHVSVQSVKSTNGKVVVQGDNDKNFEAEALLFALGRVANVDNLNINSVGVVLGSSGHIEVDEFFQTHNPNIYAVGDVIGSPALASTSMEQGRMAALHAFTNSKETFPSLYPLGIYTIPEISSCGLTEKEVSEKGYDYEIGRAYYYEIAASHITGSMNVGMFKLIFEKNSLELLGVHIIGMHATELIHIGQMALINKIPITFFIHQIFNYPTFAEGYRIAALNGFNKIKSSKKNGK